MSEDDVRLAFEAGQVALRAARAMELLTSLGLPEGHVVDHVHGFVERELQKLLASRGPAATTSAAGEPRSVRDPPAADAVRPEGRT